MKIKLALIVVFYAVGAAAQNPNDCVYPISLKSGTSTFQFCLTSS
jgi:hypothetical protein